MVLHYAFLPNIFSDTNVEGQVQFQAMKDDTDACNNPNAPRTLLREWFHLTEVPEILIDVDSVYLRYNEITTFAGVFDNIRLLNLKGNNLSIIGPSTKCQQLRYCVLSFNFLTSLPILNDFAPLIEYLDVEYNQILAIPDSICDCTNLKYFDISHNNIKRIPRLPPNLETLSAHCNQIEDADDTAISSLREVNLWKNLFTKPPMIALGCTDKVTLSFNRIHSFSVDFLALPLSTINLCMNELETIPAELFTVKTLSKIILFGNKIAKLPTALSFSNIDFLDISENPIGHLPPLPINLVELRISFCRFDDLSHCIGPANSIMRLHASGNNLQSLPSLPLIEELLVSSNKLTQLAPIRKDFLSSITLDVSFNRLTAINIDAPSRLCDLSYNALTTIPESLFANRCRVVLCGNPIDQSLDSISKVETLDVTNTMIELKGEPGPLYQEIVTPFIGMESDNKKRLLYDYSPAVGYSEMIGIRMVMEDALIIRERWTDEASLFAVFDGHGGDHCSRFAAAGFPDNLRNKSIEDVCRDYQKIVIATNNVSGTTMDLAIIKRGGMTVAHIGDGRTVLFRKDGSVKFQTQAHTPTLRTEFERLRNEKIKLKRNRVGGMLEMSRSIGDFQFQGICHDPTITEVALEDDDWWMVIACDGLWDDVDNESAFKIMSHSQSPAQAATLLRNQAYSRGSEDNISVIVIDVHSLFMFQ